MCRQHPVRGLSPAFERRGVTLIELLTVLALATVLLGIAVASASRLLARAATDNAARAIVAAHGVARFTAIMRGHRTLLFVNADSLVVQVADGSKAETVWRTTGPQVYGVSLAGPAHPLQFTPLGLPRGVSNATYRLSRGAVQRNVVISRLGRIRIVR